jgi:alpha-L-rhamnosidase
VGVHWKLGTAPKTVELQVTIPANTSATIMLMDAATVLEADGQEFKPNASGFEAEVGSGHYTVRYLLR